MRIFNRALPLQKDRYMWFTKKKRPRTPLAAEGRPPGLLGGVFLAYGIVVLHLSLIAMAILLVLMANGVVNYFIWLLLGGLGLLCGGIWLFLKKLKTKRRTLRRLL